MSLVIAICLLFAVLNASSQLSTMVAPAVATRALSLRWSRPVVCVGMWLGLGLAGAKVAATIAVGVVHLFPGTASTAALLTIWVAAVLGTMGWTILSRSFGLPVSSTHAITGALCGATLVGLRRNALVDWGCSNFWPPHGVAKVMAGLLVSPVLGLIIGYLGYRVLMLALRQASEAATRWLRAAQVVALFAQGFCYGSNDAQSVLGLVCGVCVSAGLISATAFTVPLWASAVVGSALMLGAFWGSPATLATAARGLFKLHPSEGVCAQAGSALSVYGMVLCGAPVSSTLVLSSALVGSGAAIRPRHVHWGEARHLVTAWFVTFPAALAVTALIELLLGNIIT